MAYAITRPAGLVSLVVESSPASVPFWLTELARLRADLPADVEETLRRHEAAGTTDSEEYQSTMMVFYDRHVCRVRPWPDWLQRTFDGLEANPEVYNTMNGPSEFHVIGPLKDFDITADLGRIAVPTLLFCGEFDEVTPAAQAQGGDGIRGSELVVMPGCSHMSQAEQPRRRSAWCAAGWLASRRPGPAASSGQLWPAREATGRAPGARQARQASVGCPPDQPGLAAVGQGVSQALVGLLDLAQYRLDAGRARDAQILVAGV